jgi:hypothetical protein
MRWLAGAVVVGVLGLGVWAVATLLGRDGAADRPVADVTAQPSAGGGSPEPSASGDGASSVLAEASFESHLRDTVGVATLRARPDGTRVLALTDFQVEPGPDLVVYLIPGRDNSIEGGVRLGRLPATTGERSFDVPADAQTGSVLIWSETLEMTFGAARLH